MDQAISCCCGDHQAASEIACYRDMIRLDAVRRDHNEDANNNGGVEDQRPVSVKGEINRKLDVGDYGCGERNEPCELESSNVSATKHMRRGRVMASQCLPSQLIASREQTGHR